MLSFRMFKSYVCECVVQLQACNEEGSSQWSDVVHFRTLCDRPRPPPRPRVKGKVHQQTFRIVWGWYNINQICIMYCALNYHITQDESENWCFFLFKIVWNKLVLKIIVNSSLCITVCWCITVAVACMVIGVFLRLSITVCWCFVSPSVLFCVNTVATGNLVYIYGCIKFTNKIAQSTGKSNCCQKM